MYTLIHVLADVCLYATAHAPDITCTGPYLYRTVQARHLQTGPSDVGRLGNPRRSKWVRSVSPQPSELRTCFAHGPWGTWNRGGRWDFGISGVRAISDRGPSLFPVGPGQVIFDACRVTGVTEPCGEGSADDEDVQYSVSRIESALFALAAHTHGRESGCVGPWPESVRECIQPGRQSAYQADGESRLTVLDAVSIHPYAAPMQTIISLVVP